LVPRTPTSVAKSTSRTTATSHLNISRPGSLVNQPSPPSARGNQDAVQA
jgi:hypothetical protein